MRFLTTAVLVLTSAISFANEDGAYLDPPYTDLTPPINDELFFSGFLKSNESKSDTIGLIAKNTSVKSQGSRGTCSIFSATAMLEAMLIIKKDFKTSLDLSEEYLEYLVVRNRTSDGSNSSKNFSAISRYGIPFESTMPYISDSWVNSSWLPDVEAKCGHLTENKKESCLLIHHDPDLLEMTDAEILDQDKPYYDPDFVKARAEALDMKNKYIQTNTYWYGVYGVSEVKAKLDQGIPLTIGMPVYYGAWNHRLADSYDIGRDSNNWSLGIVGFPEPGSKDKKISEENRAGHSILVVGYDDNKEVTTTVEMLDGTTKTFTYKGVYYFKNSWGTTSFGRDFTLDGKAYPGYGMITQKHAHQHGGFFHLPIE